MTLRKASTAGVVFITAALVGAASGARGDDPEKKESPEQKVKRLGLVELWSDRTGLSTKPTAQAPNPPVIHFFKGQANEVRVAPGQSALVELPKRSLTLAWEIPGYTPEAVGHTDDDSDFFAFDYVLCRWEANGKVVFTMYRRPAAAPAGKGGPRKSAQPGLLAGDGPLPVGIEERVTDVKTLAEAVEQCRKRVEKDGSPEYAVLVTEQRVKEALKQAFADYEAWLKAEAGPPGGDSKYFAEVVKPVARQILEAGVWPKGCSLSWFPDVLEGRAKAREGFHLRLTIDTPDAKFKGFGFPLIDLSFGRWNQPAGVVGKPANNGK